MTNFYVLLGISENSSEEDIRKAYRKLAKLYHPDVNNSPDAQAKFILVNKAYEILIDQKKRLRYDQQTYVRSDPYYAYNRWLQEQQMRQEAEIRSKHEEFAKRKESIKKSKLYYPYMIILYFCTITVISISLLILIGCAFTIVNYHILMFFFMMPFICLATWLLKLTLDEYKKYKAFFI